MKNLTLMRWTTEKRPLLTRLKLSAIMSGLAWAFSATLAACILMYAWVVLSVNPVYNLGSLIIAGAVLGALAGGISAGRETTMLGSLHGFLVGLCYGLLLCAFFILGSSVSFVTAEIVARVLLLGIAGALGGLLGINIKFMVSRRPAERVGKKFLQKELFFPRRN